MTDATEQTAHGVEELLEPLLALHASIREAVVDACERGGATQLASVEREMGADTIYAIDKVSEEVLVEQVSRLVAPIAPVVLVAEGLEEPLVLPKGTDPDQTRWRIIVDPIDGTRGLMYQKRSAWILTGVAPDRGSSTNLSDIVLAVQTEIPLVKQHLSDQLWARKGGGVTARRFDRIRASYEPLVVAPSTATTIEHGFATITRFFPGAREELSAIDEEVAAAVLGPIRPGKALSFEDQYISSGGELYELMVGHDRFVADLRPTVEKLLERRGVTLGICSHPYDLCTELIAREAGVVVTGPDGKSLSAPLTVDDDVAWVGYANEAIRRQVEPALQAALRHRGLL